MVTGGPKFQDELREKIAGIASQFAMHFCANANHFHFLSH